MSQEEDLRRIFDACDVSGTGWLSLQNLQDALGGAMEVRSDILVCHIHCAEIMRMAGRCTGRSVSSHGQEGGRAH